MNVWEQQIKKTDTSPALPHSNSKVGVGKGCLICENVRTVHHWVD